jgi:hypothetical protein
MALLSRRKRRELEELVKRVEPIPHPRPSHPAQPSRCRSPLPRWFVQNGPSGSLRGQCRQKIDQARLRVQQHLDHHRRHTAADIDSERIPRMMRDQEPGQRRFLGSQTFFGRPKAQPDGDGS